MQFTKFISVSAGCSGEHEGENFQGEFSEVIHEFHILINLSVFE
jgi:hypothetical protein